MLNEFRTSNKEFSAALETSALVSLVTHFRPVFHFYTPKFSDVFRGYRKDWRLERGY